MHFVALHKFTCLSMILFAPRTGGFFSKLSLPSFHKKFITTMRTKKNKEFSTPFSNSFSGILKKPVKYTPKTPTQELYVKYLQNDDVKILFGIGPAGTGKTLFACITAMDALKRGDIQKIILTRPVVAVEEEIGFLPGNLNAKMAPWTRPIFDIFLEFYSQAEIDTMLKTGIIEISPLAFMRGRTFKRCIIIADEMQNSSPNQMMMLTTRIGDNTRMIITGDLNQTDRGVNNGLKHFMDKYNLFISQQVIKEDECDNDDCDLDFEPLQNNSTAVINLTKKMGNHNDDIKIVCFHNEDVERSAIVSKVLALYAFTGNTGLRVTSDNELSKDLFLRNDSVVNIGLRIANDSLRSDVSYLLSKNDDSEDNNDAAMIPKNDMERWKNL